MTDCATQKMRFETQSALALEAAFVGGRITSDRGLVWLAKMDEQLGLCPDHHSGLYQISIHCIAHPTPASLYLKTTSPIRMVSIDLIA